MLIISDEAIDEVIESLKIYGFRVATILFRKLKGRAWIKQLNLIHYLREIFGELLLAFQDSIL
jgi:hypothetical protein